MLGGKPKLKIKKLNESNDEFFEIQDIIADAIKSIGGDMDDVTGDIVTNGDEDNLMISFYSTTDRKDARRFSKNFRDVVESALSKTRFKEVSDETHTYAYRLSRNDIHNQLGPRRGDEFYDKFAQFEILITAYGKRLEEAVTIAYDQNTIDNQIKVIEKNLEDYKKLVIEEPDDKEYWQEQIKKCQDDIDELKSYKPLQEEIEEEEVVEETDEYRIVKDSVCDGEGKKVKDCYVAYIATNDYNPSTNRWGKSGKWSLVPQDFDSVEMARQQLNKYGIDTNKSTDGPISNYSRKSVNEAWDDTETIHAAYDSYIEDCAWKQVDPISFEKFRNNYLGDKEESEEEFNSRVQYWAVYATDKETGKEYCAGVYESQRWANYWAGMDSGADAEYGYGDFEYRVEQVSEYNEEMDNSKSELIKLKLDRYDNRKYESAERLGAGKKLNESSRGFYVTTYWPDERWSPEEGGTMSYGWDANKSKFFKTEQEAQEYVDYILNGCEVLSNYEGEYEYRDEDGDLMKIAIEPFHKRGKGHSPARSWVEAEFDDPVERPYFDRKGNRLSRNPRLVAKEKKDAAELEKEFLSIINSATTRKEFIDSISDIKYSNLFSKHINTINDKWKSLKESAPICSESSEDTQFDVKIMDLERVPSILNWDIADQLQDCFRENKLWVDELHYNQVQDRIEFDINWGDWKHEHLRAKWLLQELFEKLGIVAKINSHTTEEDGSDTYSAHYNVYAIKE